MALTFSCYVDFISNNNNTNTNNDNDNTSDTENNYRLTNQLYLLENENP